MILSPTTKKTELDSGSGSFDTVAQHSTVVLLTAWKVRTLVELKAYPSNASVVLYRLLFTAAPLRVQLMVGAGNQADVTHRNSTCWSWSAVTFPPTMLTVPLSDGEKDGDKGGEKQRKILERKEESKTNRR